MRILYYETTAYYPSSAHFLEAMRDLAAERPDFAFDFFDEARFIRSSSLRSRIAARILRGRPRRFAALNRAFAQRARRFAPDIVLIAKGRRLSPDTLREIRKSTGAILINWATDDPFNPANSSPNLIASIPLYDLYVSARTAAIPDLERRGARAAYVRFGYKPEFHYPESAGNETEAARFDCDVAFIGGADADRAPWFEHLANALPGIRLNLYGSYWNRHPALRRHWRGEAIGRDYRLALDGCAIAVNLVRRANRDDHVMRTFEAPACGAFMLAERTPTHLDLFAENREAVFFSSPEELAARVREYLPRAADRKRIADAGRRRIAAGAHSYRDRLMEILGHAGALADRGARAHSRQAVA